jgi:two-component system sensor histidine kinase GlrK
MYSQIDVAYESTQSSINLELQRSAETATEAEQVSWITAVAALALSATVVFSIVRSISGSFSRLMDATRRISNERFAERIPEDRNDEFGELARSFNRMAGRLAELDQLKKNFVSSVSHELKSPIASSREIVQVLMEEIPGPLNPEQKRLLDLMGRSSGRLSSMVGSLLDVARMEAGTMSYEMRQVDVVSLVGSTLEEFEISLNERGLEATSDLPDGPLIVDCDKDRIVQVLGNLIDNAMKFSPRGSRIMVSIETGASGDRATALLSVVDFGPGVPDAHKERIFARFQQVQPQSGMNHGVGLGLAICRSIIDAHGGKIWVEDNPEGGSAFRVRLLQASSGPNPKNDSGGAPVKASA